MSNFGKLLQVHRKKCRDTTGKPLTQARLAELLVQESEKEQYSGATVSNWERGENLIRQKDRHVLVKLVTVLHQWGGLLTREEADELLAAGNYSPLNNDERQQVNPTWKHPVPTRPGSVVVPSIEEQEEMLPSHSLGPLFGRENTIDLVMAKLLSPNSPYLLVITGLGGIGKSAIAHAAAQRAIHTRQFTRVIWFSTETLQAENEMNQSSASVFRLVVEALAKQVLPDRSSDHNPSRQMARVRSELKRHPHLIIIDNLEHPSEDNYLLTQLKQLVGPTKFLLTARHRPPPDAEAYVLPLKEIANLDAFQLLRHQSQTSGEDALKDLTEEDLTTIYQVVGGHPLALRLIPQLTQIYSLSQILQGWQEGQAGYISRVYHSIYEPLWQQLRPTEKQLLQIMPLVAQGGATQNQLQIVSGLSLRYFYPALERLMTLCLLEQRGGRENPKYGIHSLTEHFLLNLNKEQEEGWMTPSFIQTIFANLNYWHRYLQQLSEKQWHLLDMERTNIFRAIRFSLTLPAEQIIPDIEKTWQEMAELLFRFVERRGYGQEWIPLLETLIQKFKGDVKGQCQLLNRLGEVYCLQQQLTKAIEIHQAVLEESKQIEDELEIGRTHFNLGNDYYLNRQYQAAEQHTQTAFNIFSHLGLSGRESAAALNLLGTVTHAQQLYDVSEQYLKRAASIWLEIQQPSELARTLNNLAITLQKQQRVEEAFECYRKAKTALTKSASELDQILIYLSEGSLYSSLKRYHEAEATFKKIHLTFLEEAGHLFYQALTLNNLGIVALAQGNYAKAEEVLQKCLGIWQQMGDNIEVADTLRILGRVAANAGHYETAVSRYQEASKLLSEHPDDSRFKQLQQKIHQALEEIHQKGEVTNQVAG